ncbi:MFS transporter [Sinomonas sp. ASV486]|uniref:MFS transporter n=1 Tax=Sinomonas sp. ASV486 TaxID=3051170 RepID=UPI0027DE426A|nr:MFS transporter [Sinomonas sp. ASV486]MDQ4490536.1 MFS transporter [Sinomonas sp. ASV486]
MNQKRVRDAAARPWRGRLLVMAGVLLVAFTLRTAVTSVPPLTPLIGGEILPPWLLGLLGMVPTALFGVAGLLTPLIMRAWSVEAIAVAAMAVSGAGQILRAGSGETGLFFAGSILALAGMGVGNVVLPPMVKKYFPDRVGLVTALYVTVVSLGTAVPPLLAVPVAEAAGWRTSIGWWAAINVLAILPWLRVWPPRGRGGMGAAAAQAARDAADAPRVVVRPWRSPAAWALALLFGCTSLNTYTMFAWLPTIVSEAGLSAGAAGFQLALFAGLGLPTSLFVPVLAGRLRNPFPLVVFGLACFVGGYLGLWLAPGTATWVWVSLAGLGPTTFPLALVLVNLRTRTHQASGAVSGFAQGIAYTIACAGPLVAGLLHEATGGWTAMFGFLAATLVVLGVSGWVICRPHFIDEQPRVVEFAERPRFQPDAAPPVG